MTRSLDHRKILSLLVLLAGFAACSKPPVGIADELGYLLYPEDLFNPLYSYEKSAGMSPHWGGTLVEKNAVDLVSQFGAQAGACK